MTPGAQEPGPLAAPTSTAWLEEPAHAVSSASRTTPTSVEHVLEEKFRCAVVFILGPSGLCERIDQQESRARADGSGAIISFLAADNLVSGPIPRMGPVRSQVAIATKFGMKIQVEGARYPEELEKRTGL